MQLDLAGVAVSMGSACASGSNQPSPSLRAMGLPDDQLRSTVRFSLGAATTDAEIEEAVRRVAAVVSVTAGEDAVTLDSLQTHCRVHLAGYKVPRALVLVDEVQRGAAGKPDYRWAKDQTEERRPDEASTKHAEAKT